MSKLDDDTTQKQPPSLLPAQGCWDSVAHAHRVWDVVRQQQLPKVVLALLGLVLGSSLRPLILLPTWQILLILLGVSGRTPAPWLAFIMVTVYCTYVAWHIHSFHQGLLTLCSLFSTMTSNCKILSIFYTAMVLHGVILIAGCLVFNDNFFGVIPVDETIPLKCFQNLPRYDLLVPTGWLILGFDVN